MRGSALSSFHSFIAALVTLAIIGAVYSGISLMQIDSAHAGRVIQIEPEPAPAPCTQPYAHPYRDPGFLLVSDGSDSSSAPVLAPADKLHDPVLAPLEAMDDARAMQKLGWPLALLASLIMVARGLASAGKRWPSVRWLAWLNTGVRAFAIAGVATVAAAAFNTLALGGTWFAVAMAAAGAGLAMLVPSPPPKSP